MDDDCRRGRPPLAGECGEDRISCLPDELLHGILLCLGSARAAARTSVLSRRWHRVWTYLPELVLSGDNGPPPASSFPDTVDAALAAYAAPTLKRLSISGPDHGPGPSIPAHRIAPWLRFASQRVSGEIYLYLSPDMTPEVGGEEEAELELPTCGAATTITLSLEGSLKVRPAGVFAALTGLKIDFAGMDGRELSDLVSTQCPRLKELDLSVTLDAVSDVFIHSDSLHSLSFFVPNTRRLEVVAPRLEELFLELLGTDETHISAPKLAYVGWSGEYDPHRHQFTPFSHRLRRLELALKTTTTPLMEQFNEVDELRLLISINEWGIQYESFLNETNKLSKCETLWIDLALDEHGLTPAILHLFRCCNSINKLSIQLMRNPCGPSLRYSCPLACPCRLAESCEIDDIALSSLGEVEIYSFVGSHDEMEFVEQLSRCNAPVLKKLVINCETEPDFQLTKEVCEKVRSISHPNLKVEFYVMSEQRRVCFD